MTSLVSELYFHIIQSIQKSVKDKKIGIAFSGGVDSSLLAKICVDLCYEVTLLTIGFEDSHDIIFSQEISKILGYNHKIEKMKLTNFQQVSREIKNIIHDSDDLLRKHIIRELALKIGVPEISSNKRKKALQYGSLIHKTLMKIR